MLQWCHSTRHTLDRHGRNYASAIWHYASSPRTTTITKHKRPETNHSISSHDVQAGKRLVTQVSISTEPSYRATRRPSRNGSIETSSLHMSASSHGLLSSFDGLGTALEGGGDATPSSAQGASPVPDNVILEDTTPDTRIDSSSTLPSGKTNTPHIIIDLAQLLSPRSRDANRSLTALTELYKLASERSQLRHLSTRLFSDILSLCGTLYFSSRQTSNGAGSPLVQYFQRSLDATASLLFIIEVGHDMEKFGIKLSSQSRYWIMQAYLALARGNNLKKFDQTRRRESLSLARAQYQYLRNDPDIPEAHLAYLTFLLSSNNNHVQEAAGHLCNVFEITTNPHLRFAEIFWEILTLRAAHLPSKTKARICQTAFERIGAGATPTCILTRPTNDHPDPLPPSTPNIPVHNLPDIAQLSAAFASTLFPCYSTPESAPFRDWAEKQTCQALAPHLPIDVRWNNLVLLAVSMSPAAVPVKYQSSSTVSPNPGNTLWRTALMLESLKRRLASASPDLDVVRNTAKNVARPLWRMFMRASSSGQSFAINRAYAVAFFHLAAKSRDDELRNDCHDFCLRQGLWQYRTTDSRAEQMQAVETIVAYSAAFVACKWQDWSRIYSMIETALPGIPWKVDVTNTLIEHYLSENVNIAFNVFLYSRQNRIAVSEGVLRKLGVALANAEQWKAIPAFLDEASFPRTHIELVLGSVMRVFQQQQYEHGDAALMKISSRLACKLYADEAPSASLKYPLRYFLLAMIRTQNTRSVVQLVASLQKTAPEIFDIRFIRRLVLQLTGRRQYSSAFRIYGIFEGSQDPALARPLEDIRRKLALKFSASGAHMLTRNLVRRSKNQVTSLSRRDALVRAVSFRRLPLSPLYYAQVRPIIGDASAHNPTIRHAISVLVKGRRLYAARKLYAKSHSILDPKTSVAIGNIILHGPMSGGTLRNGRLVRNILRTKDRLASECGFLPDRTTINIMLKSLLRWTAMFDATRVRKLFDQMAHEGYPVPARWRRKHGVPFESPRGAFNGFSIPSLSVYINFNKHVRPMYKMFIKAFYLRKDVSAAKMVVGILKEVQAEEMQEREKRNRARRQGVIKKKMRETKEREAHQSP